ncbi:MAG: T9SS type A sorting domain-containing protein, partial [Bacteroidales bacterium]|nr:T9SS type A sorting domain-containing protein [Bacteroidales bacterium]
RQKAETYLAIKHDITISEYVSESGDTLWDNEEEQTRRVFGMAHDSILGLYKTTCGDREGLTIEATDSLKAGDYLLCGEKSGLSVERKWRIVREGLAGKTVIAKVGRNGQWREQEPVAILKEERDGISTETQYKAVNKDNSHYYFAVRFGDGKRSTYEFSLSANDSLSNTLADTPLEKRHKHGEATSPATASNIEVRVELYPNPANDFAVIRGMEGEKKEVEIINAVGLTCKKNILGENERSIDISVLAPGHYIVVLRGGGNEYRVKLIKK